MVQRFQDVSDISSADELIRYAVRAQLALVSQSASQNTIALAIGIGANRTSAGANLSHALQTGALSDTKLQRLDEVVVALAPPNRSNTGGLSSLAVRLRGFRDKDSLSDRVPSSWAREVLQKPADSEIGVITQASALLSAFLTADRIDKSDRNTRAVRAVHDQYHNEIRQVVDQLIVMGTAPPTVRSTEALIILGTLGSYAFDIIRPILTNAITSPLGFRVWRAITYLVKLSRPTSIYTRDVRVWVAQLLGEAEELRKKSIYPSDSLDVELAISVPEAWSPPENDWVSSVLLSRFNNREATIQERGTAAMGLWQRIVEGKGHDQAGTNTDLLSLIAQFEMSEDSPDTRLGMQWIETTLKYAVEHRISVCNAWPKSNGEQWLQRVYEAAKHLELQSIPENLLPGTKTLFLHILLQNASAYRRNAIETVVAGGLTESVASALEKFLDLERAEPWLRIRAASALALMQQRDHGVERALTNACRRAYQNLATSPTLTQIDEMNAALFAVGDCFGVTGLKENDVKRVRESIRDVLVGIVDTGLTTETLLFPVSRAAAYLLTFTMMPRSNNYVDLSQKLLESLREHPDEITRHLGEWAIENRVDEHGAIRPLVETEYG